jgi:DNA polymerase
MAQVLALALPGALEKAAKVLKLDNQKDAAGNRLMKQLARPRRARKNEDKSNVYYFSDAERMTMLDAYCKQDVATAREIHQRLPQLSENERLVWLLDQRINDRGFYMDRKLAEAARKIAAAANPIINTELARITNDAVTAFTQVARLTEWLKQHIDVDTLGKGAIDDLLELELPEDVRRVLELRLLGAQAAVAKVDALLQRRCSDGRVRGSFVYHAAGPGRWSSRGAQVHNLKRPLTEDLEKAIEVIGTGDIELARKQYDNPLSVIGDCIRGMICAAPGHTLIGGDFSGIEARVTAWIAGEESKLDVFRAYDAGNGPDPYIIAAGKIFAVDPIQLAAGYKAGNPVARERRQAGKAAELAFGYQGGVGAYRKFAPDTELTDAEIHSIKNAWRRAHPNIEQFWNNIDRAAHLAARNPGSVVSIGNKLQLTCDDSPFLWLTLPSGRKLAYPQARRTRAFIFGGKIVEHERGHPCLLFKDAASGQWRDVKIYGGLLCENGVQAIARDLLAEAMLRIDAAGYSIVTHVHDEIVIEQAESIKPRFTKLMMQLPEWAEGLPIMVNTWVNTRYIK